MHVPERQLLPTVGGVESIVDVEDIARAWRDARGEYYRLHCFVDLLPIHTNGGLTCVCLAQ